jgi:fructoselysine-6-P-deglycase FrlB-like protein
MNGIMWREIASQPVHIREALAPLRRAAAELEVRPRRILAGGCGDSYYAAVVASGVFDALGVTYSARTAQEIEQFEAIGPDDLVVLSSVSGSTQRTVAAALASREAGAETLAITCDPHSPLAEVCDRSLLLPYTPLTRETPHTVDYAMTLLALAVIAESVHCSPLVELDALPDLLQAELSGRKAELQRIAADFTGQTSFFFLGAGPAIGTCMYGAAKMHESGGVVACHCETENFWHGMNFMVRAGACVVVLENQHEPEATEQLLLDNLARLTPSVLYVGTRALAVPHRAALSRRGVVSSAFLHALATQLLCYSRAMSLGVDVVGPARHMVNGKAHEAAQDSWTSHRPADSSIDDVRQVASDAKA